MHVHIYIYVIYIYMVVAPADCQSEADTPACRGVRRERVEFLQDVRVDLSCLYKRARASYTRGPKDHLNTRISIWSIVYGMEYMVYGDEYIKHDYKAGLLESHFFWALESESTILAFVRPLGPPDTDWMIGSPCRARHFCRFLVASIS